MYRDIWGSANYIYDFATLPDAYAKQEWLGYRIKKGESYGSEEAVKVIHPNLSVRFSGRFLLLKTRAESFSSESRLLIFPIGKSFPWKTAEV